MTHFLLTEGFNSLVFLFLLLVLSLLFRKRFFSTGSKLPPGPTPWPLIGNIHHIGSMPHATLANFARIYGPIMTLKLGGKYLIVGSSPSIAMEILKKQDLVLSGRDIPRAFPYTRQELNQISIGWTEEFSERPKYLKSLCKLELFSGKALISQECLRGRKVLEMVDFLKAREGEVINIRQITFATTFNMLSNIFLSKDMISLKEGDNNSIDVPVRKILEVISAPNLADFNPAFSGLDLQGLRKKADLLWQEAWSILEPIIEEKRKHINGNQDHKYRDFGDNLVGLHFTNHGINEILIELFTAGSDTTTSTIEWMMSELIRNPHVMHNLREELKKEINADTIEESQLLNLPYLQACLKETLRLYPPVPLLLPRRALETCQVMNYTIPKNAQVLVNVWAIGRDPTIWENPMDFKPERFLDSPVDFKGNCFEFLPFGSGRRMCPGYPMVTTQVPLVIATLVHRFNWSLPKEEEADMLDMKEKFGLTLHKHQPLLLIPHIRT